jgi:hypothetical protein
LRTNYFAGTKKNHGDEKISYVWSETRHDEEEE